MWYIERHKYEGPSVTLKVIFALFNFSNFHMLGNVTLLTTIRIRKRMWLAILSVLSKLMIVQGHRQSRTCRTLQIWVGLMSRKQCKIETLLLQTTNRELYMDYRIAAIPMTLSDLQGHSLISMIFEWNFSNSCKAVDKKISTGIARLAVPRQP